MGFAALYPSYELLLGANIMIAVGSSSSRCDGSFLLRRVTLYHILHAAFLVCFLCASSVHSARATNFLLEDFVEADDATVRAIAPRLPEAYPGARFLINGISGPAWTWKFIRVENTSACENEICPTIVVHDRVEWKILVLASKRVEVSLGSLNEGTAICTFFSKGDSKFILRYSDEEKVLFVVK